LRENSADVKDWSPGPIEDVVYDKPLQGPILSINLKGEKTWLKVEGFELGDEDIERLCLQIREAVTFWRNRLRTNPVKPK